MNAKTSAAKKHLSPLPHPPRKSVANKKVVPASTSKAKPEVNKTKVIQQANTTHPAIRHTEVKSPKEKKQKVIRDSFSIPKAEFEQIADIKSRALGLGIGVKKSELLRAGLLLLCGLNDNRLKQAIAAVPTLKTGRPAKR